MKFPSLQPPPPHSPQTVLWHYFHQKQCVLKLCKLRASATEPLLHLFPTNCSLTLFSSISSAIRFVILSRSWHRPSLPPPPPPAPHKLREQQYDNDMDYCDGVIYLNLQMSICFNRWFGRDSLAMTQAVRNFCLLKFTLQFVVPPLLKKSSFTQFRSTWTRLSCSSFALILNSG